MCTGNDQHGTGRLQGDAAKRPGGWEQGTTTRDFLLQKWPSWRAPSAAIREQIGKRRYYFIQHLIKLDLIAIGYDFRKKPLKA